MSLPIASNLYNTRCTHFGSTLHGHARPLQHREHWCKQLTFLHIKYHRQSLSWVSVINFALDDFTTLPSDMLHYLHPWPPWTSHICHCNTLNYLWSQQRANSQKPFIELKIKVQNKIAEWSTWDLNICMHQRSCIKYQIFLKHKQTMHQGDPNSWSSSTSPLTDIRAPLIVYSRLLGWESFPTVQVSCSTTKKTVVT